MDQPQPTNKIEEEENDEDTWQDTMDGIYTATGTIIVLVAAVGLGYAASTWRNRWRN